MKALLRNTIKEFITDTCNRRLLQENSVDDIFEKCGVRDYRLLLVKFDKSISTCNFVRITKRLKLNTYSDKKDFVDKIF